MSVCWGVVGSVGSAVMSLQSTQQGWKKQRKVRNGCDGDNDEYLKSLLINSQ